MFLEAISVSCAYFTRMHDRLDDIPGRRRLAFTPAHSARAWSESSLRVGLSAEHTEIIDVICQHLAGAFFGNPWGLPYPSCLIGLVKRESMTIEPGGEGIRRRSSREIPLNLSKQKLCQECCGTEGL
ncbi:MAG: hypothetical protein QMD46_09735 [Methanomicrobiales archaeon]|nr:hypothetical protein [Methanomicrobiales archaeon]MDI6877371.1 hypothetical protein [Methanomicrobiales archaeon]